MEHSVEIESIPSNLQFPGQFEGRIRHDPAHQQLVFRGFMCKSDYDQLLRLSQDVQYQTAIVQLFQLSTLADAPQLRLFGRVLAALTIGCLLLAAIVWWSLLHNLPNVENNGTSSAVSHNCSLEIASAARSLHTPYSEPMSARS